MSAENDEERLPVLEKVSLSNAFDRFVMVFLY